MHQNLNILLFWLCLFGHMISVQAQVICITCYDQNETISSGVNNLIQNGGFETTNCTVYSDYICPNSSTYSGCIINNWIVSDGGIATYAQMMDANSSIVPEGNKVIYLGNSFAQMCSETFDDTSCVVPTNCFIPTLGIQKPFNLPEYGESKGVSVSQVVNGLTIGNKYFLEFWSGGEGPVFYGTGVFGINFGFGYYLMTNIQTYPGEQEIGKRYLIEFKAIATSHEIKFTNWGHICFTCTEAIFDDVKLYVFSEVSPSVELCDQNSTVPPTFTDIENPPGVPPTELISLFIPNVLTPNQDDINDIFKIQYIGNEKFELEIVNRWGELVFESASQNISWDGTIGNKPASEGIYFYKLLIGQKNYHGFLTLVR